MVISLSNLCSARFIRIFVSSFGSDDISFIRNFLGKTLVLMIFPLFEIPSGRRWFCRYFLYSKFPREDVGSDDISFIRNFLGKTWFWWYFLYSKFPREDVVLMIFPLFKISSGRRWFCRYFLYSKFPRDDVGSDDISFIRNFLGKTYMHVKCTTSAMI